MDDHYTPDFYSEIGEGSYSSAMILLPTIFERQKPRSVIDVGCGAGAWTAAIVDFGVPKVVGVDGPWIANAKRFRPGLDIRMQDLEQSLEIDDHFDLCLCLEVAEHLTPQRSGDIGCRSLPSIGRGIFQRCHSRTTGNSTYQLSMADLLGLSLGRWGARSRRCDPTEVLGPARRILVVSTKRFALLA